MQFTIEMLPIAGCIAVLSIALCCLLIQIVMSRRAPENRFHPWGAFVSFITAIFTATSLVQYLQPSTEVALLSERIQYMTFPILAHGLYGFAASFRRLNFKIPNRLLTAFDVVMIGIVLIPGLVFGDEVIYREISRFVPSYPEPKTTIVSLFYISVCYVVAFGSIILWFRFAKRNTAAYIYLVGTGIWALTAFHDVLMTLGLPSLMYLMSYGVVGFNIAVVLSTLEDYFTTKRSLQAHKNGLEQTIAERTRDLGRKSVELSEQLLHQHEIEEQLRHAQRMESVGALAGGIAHEFNNILTGIIGFAELARIDSPGSAYIQNILDFCRRAADLITSILTFSRRSESNKGIVKVNTCIDEVIKIIEPTIPKNISVRTDLQRRLPLIFADESQIEQVIMNICKNSVDAMPDGGLLRIATREIDESVRIEIEDSGEGMDEHTLSRVFDPFFSTKSVGSGTGLGLSIVYGIVQDHEGRIECRSDPGLGTKFTLSFPESLDSSRITDAESDSADPPAGGNETILIVDDEPALRAIAMQTLQVAGYGVLEAADGKSAIEVFDTKAEMIDLVVIDIGMPLISGIEALSIMNERRPEIRALVTSGYEHNSIHFDSRNGRTKFVSKPYSSGVLLRAVRDMLEQPIADTIR